ncbi:MAG: hypothetical protein H7Z75_16095 [Ferruginibacter sp.]|nr:hypothetical protein [Cytophagales bacterium]
MLLSDSTHSFAEISAGSFPFNRILPAAAETYAPGKPLKAARLAQLAVKEVWMAPKTVLANAAAPGNAQPTDVFLVTVVTDNQSNDPVQFQIKSFRNPARGGFLPLPSCGAVGYRSDPEKRPTSLDYRILLIETPLGMHEVNSLYQRVVNDSKYRSVRSILTNVATVAPPSASLMAVASDVVLNLTTRLIQGDEETTQLICARGSFDKNEDNLGTRYGLISQANPLTRIKYQVEIV